MHGHRKLMTICSAAVLALGLAACGSSSDDDQAMCPEGQVGTPPACEAPPTLPTAYETAKEAIQEADTEEAAQAAYDAAQDNVSGTESASLRMALNMRLGELAAASRAETQKTALMTAAGMIDTSDLSTQEAVNAARMAIAGLREALTNAADVSDADKAMYQTTLTNAVNAVDTAQGGIDTATRRTNQMKALSDASGDLQDALAALTGQTPTQAQLNDANEALTALNTAITGGADLTDTEKAPYQREADNAAMPIRTAQNAFNLAKDDADDTADRAMRLTASRLYGGIGTAPLTNTGDGARSAAYSGTNDAEITVTMDDAAPGDGTDVTQVLRATKMMVADNHGWEGKQYAASGTGVDGTYEAVVYSDVRDPTPGDKFSEEYADDAAITAAIIATTNSGRVASPRFDQSTGIKRHPLPSPNPSNAATVTIPGSFHGVAGTYSCTPGAGAVCATRRATTGYELGTVPSQTDATWTAASTQWTFKPTSADARVTEMADTSYASYGWWLHKSADGRTWTASAFVDDKVADLAIASGVDALNGSATYQGGAAGKYALFSLTGGTNDAGHFTARATLEANFNNDTVSGTIDQFIGEDGMVRDWKVGLMESHIGDDGALIGTADGTTAATAAQMTTWTIGDSTAGASGQWSGFLRDNGDEGVPTVATGTFSARHANTGRMVGAFGANKQ